MSEVWRDVPEWEGLYQVSDAGGVRSIDRRLPVVNRFGNIENRLHRGKVLKAGVSKNGYPIVMLTRPGPIKDCRYVHDLVTLTFLGPRKPGQEVCHKDGVRANVALSNLRYDTRSANALDRHKHGTMNQAHGEEHYFAKLTVADVKWIRAKEGSCSIRSMARDLGVSHSTVANVLNGTSWRHA